MITRLYFWITIFFIAVALYYVITTLHKLKNLEAHVLDPQLAEMQTHDTNVPKVYQILYVKKNGDEWHFLKKDSEQFVKDVLQSQINTLMIMGSIFMITKKQETDDHLVLDLERRCDNKFYAVCGAKDVPSEYNSILHVLGYVL